MSIDTDEYIYKLRIRIDGDAPPDFMKRWKNLKEICEYNKNNKDIILLIKENCKLEQNKNLPYLNRCEGGLGGDSNTMNKQMRFRTHRRVMDNDIVFDNILGAGDEYWTYDELDDIVSAFIKVAEQYVQEKCVIGCIEVIGKNKYR
jgi:hypothetical protein